MNAAHTYTHTHSVSHIHTHTRTHTHTHMHTHVRTHIYIATRNVYILSLSLRMAYNVKAYSALTLHVSMAGNADPIHCNSVCPHNDLLGELLASGANLHV